MLYKIALIVALGAIAASAADSPILHPDCPANGNPQNPMHLPFPNDCTKFYKCNGKYAHEMDCPTGLHWNQQNQWCDYPEKALCDPNVITNPGSDVILNHPGCDPKEDPQHPTHLSHPTDCTKFYKCDRGNAYPINCPKGLHWYQEKEWCDYPENAQCDPNIVGPITKPESGVILNHPGCDPKEDPQHPTHLSHPTDCTKFYKCDRGNAYPINCPGNLHWNAEKDYCDYQYLANCQAQGSSRILSAEAIDGPHPDPKCQQPNEDPQNPTLIPYPDNCEKFQICNGGLAFPMDCPAGLHWDDTYKMCNWPLSAGCYRPQ